MPEMVVPKSSHDWFCSKKSSPNTRSTITISESGNSDGWSGVSRRLFRTKSVMGRLWDDHFRHLGHPPKCFSVQDAGFIDNSSSWYQIMVILMRNHWKIMSRSEFTRSRLRNSDGWSGVWGGFVQTKSVMGRLWNDHFRHLGHPSKLYRVQDAGFIDGSWSW